MNLLSYLHYIVCLIFLIGQSFCLCFAQDDNQFTIIRKLQDLFIVRSASKCRGTSDPGCLKYNPKAFRGSKNCQCGCPHEAATFGFYSGSWTCLDNTKVRQQTGCKYKFNLEDSNPLKILDEGDSYNAELSSGSCSIDPKTSHYFRCDGTWDKIGSQSFNPWLNITRSPSSGLYIYQVNIGFGISKELLGRIISLNINCNEQEPSCLLFKLKGALQCPEHVMPMTTKRSTISSTSVLNAKTNPNKNPKNEGKTSGVSSTLVGVVVTLVIIVVIVIVIVAFVYWKRKRGESVWLVDQISSRVRKLRSSQPKKKAENSVDDPEYAEIPEEQQRKKAVDEAGGVYSYAFDDPQTAYVAPQPAPYNRLVHNHRVPDQEGAMYSTADDGHVYNVLERPPSVVNQMTSENLDNHMDKVQSIQDLDPVYHVLEESMITDETGGNESTRNDSHVVP